MPNEEKKEPPAEQKKPQVEQSESDKSVDALIEAYKVKYEAEVARREKAEQQVVSLSKMIQNIEITPAKKEESEKSVKELADDLV